MLSDVLAEILVMPALLTAATAGLCCAIAQALLTLLFARMPGFWSQKPAFVAHQVVALPLMLYVAYLGCAGWSRPAPPTVDDRVFGFDPIGAHLVAVLLGALLLWDIPMTLVPSICGWWMRYGLGRLASAPRPLGSKSCSRQQSARSACAREKRRPTVTDLR